MKTTLSQKFKKNLQYLKDNNYYVEVKAISASIIDLEESNFSNQANIENFFATIDEKPLQFQYTLFNTNWKEVFTATNLERFIQIITDYLDIDELDKNLNK